MAIDEPVVTGGAGFLRNISGTFFRAVDAAHANAALSGSRRAGRYSAPDQPALYLSASPDGVAAAMIAHGGGAAPTRAVLAFQVMATDVFDLREEAAIAAVRAAAGDPFAGWQEQAAMGDEPPSWRVRAWIEARGANGLIDPSRKAPGLWHLVLFRWNVPGAPVVVPYLPGEPSLP
ncbi:RES family NAD+ phosphorylase [Sphingomonas sp. AR_OL41]|uniref:RES family NAD+ phosphorylase n=1 Tax=Sphingomonas sp. AR_OL41 TaxID=3042729 RepID=UPI002480DBE1|nr:RES family NAD+ phosphorylase [Sphingomonas sp. AR_OL41]MDH7974499.1 RES family NAD+ phosphorylase [Sphingomonas sp. AR_OL41]